MIHFFGNQNSKLYAVQAKELSQEAISKLVWLFANQPKLEQASIDAFFVGPRAAMITPWSTNAVEITQNMGIEGIVRIEEFQSVTADFADFDPMISEKYKGLNQQSFIIDIQPEAIVSVEDISAYNKTEGLSLSDEEVEYLESVSKKIGRALTDSEVFGFSQVNSEHCRHKIFNGTFIIDGEEKPNSLFKLIKETAKQNPNTIVSAYKDNVAFINGPTVEQFAPKRADVPDFYTTEDFESVISLKAETHNFPTTVEPFNGAATGAGGEIRDRLAGGKGSLPLAGTAVYMTSYSRLEPTVDSAQDKPWEKSFPARQWLYQKPLDILIKASNGASDFGNKFGQPLICGSILTFEHDESQDASTETNTNTRKLAYDKVIMQAGGIGYGKLDQAIKEKPEAGDQIVVLGGENYRIGMGGAAVSSADTGALASGIELNAVQRSNPEMQKRAANVIRGMVESDNNTIISIHDHGAGGHLNCLSELIEDTGGCIDLDQLPVGDPTLSDKEIIGNESQERMGLLIAKKNLDHISKIAARERSPLYTVGEVTNDKHFCFTSKTKGNTPMALDLEDMFGSSPKTVMTDKTIKRSYDDVTYNRENFHEYLEQLLQLEAVACKDWLTNKVDRCVGGRVAKQQCVGPLQLPLNNMGVMALDFKGKEGVATSIGHSPISGLIDPVAGSRNSITEALTNIIWAPLKDNLKSVSLSANWMWPCKNEGEDARLYEAVKAISEFAIDLGINVPTGKDSLSMKQKYADGDVISPGTVIISAAGNCSDITKVVEPVFQKDAGAIYYINLSQDDFKLGGSSFAQINSKIGSEAPTVKSAGYVKTVFDTLQELIKANKIVAGHDVASGGLITTLLELCFADNNLGASLNLTELGETDSFKILFAENSGIVFQSVDASVEEKLSEANIAFFNIGHVLESDLLNIINGDESFALTISDLRDTWFKTSYLFDQKQTANNLAKARFDNYKNQALDYKFPQNFSGQISFPTGATADAAHTDAAHTDDAHTDTARTDMARTDAARTDTARTDKSRLVPTTRIDSKENRPKAAILREKGSNSEREMANALYLAGFEVKDVHMTDLISGRENLKDIQFLGAVGGFSNSDVLGSAKGWAGAIKYNETANKVIKDFFEREDTLSIGICNGAQLFMELDLINPEHDAHGKLTYNDSHKHESGFTSVDIQENNSVMLKSLAGSRLGVWISHGEGKFKFPKQEHEYDIVAKYGYEAYPANPNGSHYNTAMLCDKTGRHLVTMPHIERSTFPWNWAHYPKNRSDDKVSPWLEAFVNAKNWILKSKVL
ncbi:phosphoribosylformylglycinamidine synthase [Subsaximicrobium wynnwilliamsii]|uniref:Phosphoribosylformylglycinamidine synthase n=1 Tax=Subsaximicrobium wynnwilliamsii TaxID=291179 RepID=A0A5C6ZMG6_9FLAO|nr:phosphoribosylformylglycinamidine synthase [Subsaximicrobium wynnwilliamsii]TXD84830.1 phosphoribosylformylglycinamidine synthase [Subsaximicrobium wynnwilliamsii]TXD90501.1 phosphoribosylformylglycinamidine synthase [Subsaximicrobium wynnwilliamsii]TXE04976.1 phosphoribosylformylglycinamidine synthase [Subsaximicrobium wynnwilliamsii]